ncbi:hypothetical protein [Methanogenium cariaci]|uniref:hypothetical protein n=1 Tax=Methanogenium cariaci TaxID=2197 RepID=UPI0012F6FAEA|nr:hypothetical protein [Methanogenium cariaci]
MLGAAIGDALGMPQETLPPPPSRVWGGRAMEDRCAATQTRPSGRASSPMTPR